MDGGKSNILNEKAKEALKIWGLSEESLLKWIGFMWPH